MSSRERAETCKHSTGRVGNTAVFTLPTCPYMHMIKNKIVTTRIRCKDCRFYEERKDARRQEETKKVIQIQQPAKRSRQQTVCHSIYIKTTAS